MRPGFKLVSRQTDYEESEEKEQVTGWNSFMAE
jgi:hypothetical protein